MEWAERLRLDEGNVRRAVRWYFANDITPLPHIFRILWLDWQMRDRMPEGHDWLDELLDRADELDDASRAQLLLMAAVTEGEVGNDDAALSVSTASKRCKDASTIPISRLHRSSCSRGPDRSTETSRARSHAAERALEGFRRQDELGVGGFAPFITASALLTLGMLDVTLGRHDDAREHLGEVIAQGDRFWNAFLATSGRAQMASLAVSVGDLDDARRLLREALDVPHDDALSTHPLSFSLVAMAHLLVTEGDARRAAVALGAADALRQRGWTDRRGRRRGPARPRSTQSYDGNCRPTTSPRRSPTALRSTGWRRSPSRVKTSSASRPRRAHAPR